jgi:hypothetical protein
MTLRKRIYRLNHRETLVVDPQGCGCTDCVIHESWPVETLSEDQLDRVALDDYVIDRTGMSPEEWDNWL